VPISSQDGWCILDFTLVIFSTVVLIVNVIAASVGGDSAEDSKSQTGFIRVVKLYRSTKMIKVGR